MCDISLRSDWLLCHVRFGFLSGNVYKICCKREETTNPSYPYESTCASAVIIAPAMPPKIPGIPCKLCTPHVSWILRDLAKNDYG